ncbi:hypothetical protein PAXINDRAFT_18159 [Paxillus involutus ATCC 200175]|uniref:Wax synthase domain-containing protein n=1 Tax=Paxillus involutus ATCC 200175 TaxID=664439 RepID=A0A0C9SP71_PAXIN|nr:hypothetical protein PAXINDRAFT_18159 [Paxillus involutus ATCC 200175]
MVVKTEGSTSTIAIMMSFAALSWSAVLLIQSTQAPIDPANFVSSFDAISIDLSLDVPQPQHLNVELVSLMFIIATRTLEWALQKEPLKRHIRPAGATPSTIMDAFDLAVNLCGVGWDWSKGLRVPRETRPSTHSFSPDTFGSIIGGTIFDETLPFFLRYLRSSIIATLIASGMYCFFQTGYNLCIVPAVLILRQDPTQWPPTFECPCFAISVSDFWGRRWHQFRLPVLRGPCDTGNSRIFSAPV